MRWPSCSDRTTRTHGNTLVPFSRVRGFVRTSRPLYAHDSAPPGPVEDAIGANVASLVEDGATLQTGIGAIPDAALRRLADKRRISGESSPRCATSFSAPRTESGDVAPCEEIRGCAEVSELSISRGNWARPWC